MLSNNDDRSRRASLICLLLAQGKTIQQSAEIIGMNPEYVERLLSDPKIKELREHYRQEVLERMLQQFTEDPVLAKLREAAPKAAARLEHEVDNKESTPKDRLTGADSILGKLGYTDKVPAAAQQNNVLLNIDPEVLEDIYNRKSPGPDHVTG